MVAPSSGGLRCGRELRHELSVVVYVGKLGSEVAHPTTWRTEAISTQAAPLFLGLILGEFSLTGIWTIVGIALNLPQLYQFWI